MNKGKIVFSLMLLYIIIICSMVSVSAFDWSDHMVHYYKLDGTTGVVTDSLGTASGTILNGTTRGVVGKINNAFDFEASNQNIVNLSSTPFPIGDWKNLTITMWIKPESYPVSFIAPMYSDRGSSQFFGLTGNGDPTNTGKLKFNNVYGNTNLTLGQWYFVSVVIIDGISTTFYVNGSNDGTKAASVLANGVASWLGGEPQLGDPNYFYDGYMDEVGFWNRSLNSTEILELYNSGSGLPYSGPGLGPLSLNYPANDTILSVDGANFNSVGDELTLVNWTNITYYVWNDTGIFNSTFVDITDNSTFNETLFIDSFILGSYEWNVYGCYGNSTYSNCTWAEENYTFNVGANINSIDYNTEVYETSSQTFTANITLIGSSDIYDVKLVYNGTSYDGSFSLISGNDYSITATIDIPTILSNNTFYWRYVYTIGNGLFFYQNSENYYQNVSMIDLSYCLAGNKTLFFDAKNEENQTAVTGFNFLGTFTYWLGLGSVYKNVSVNNLTFKTSSIIQYEKEGFVKRNYYLNNATITNITTNISLYLLDSAVSTSFIVSVKDASQLPITDAYIYVQRYYPGTGEYQTVAMAKTDNSGNTVAHFEAETEDYRIIVIKNGIVLYTSQVQKVYCSATPCTLPLQIDSTPVSSWKYYGNLSNLVYAGPFFNLDTKMINFTYIDTSGTTSFGRLLVYKIDPANGKEYICNVTSTSNAATLTCNVTGYTGEIYAEGYISRSPPVLIWAETFMIQTIKTIMGMEGLFWGLMILMVIAIAGLLIAGLPGLVVGSMLSVMIMGFIGLASFGLVTIWVIIIIGMVILWLTKA